MPTYEYHCENCSTVFEEILLLPDDVKKYAKQYPCNKCNKMALRIEVSITNFNFKGPAGAVQGSGVHGQSGSHDLDYPSIDKAIGRSASKKWQEYDKRKAARDKVRKEAGTNSISTAGGVITPLDKSVSKVREKGLKTWSKRDR